MVSPIQPIEVESLDQWKEVLDQVTTFTSPDEKKYLYYKPEWREIGDKKAKAKSISLTEHFGISDKKLTPAEMKKTGYRLYTIEEIKNRSLQLVIKAVREDGKEPYFINRRIAPLQSSLNTLIEERKRKREQTSYTILRGLAYGISYIFCLALGLGYLGIRSLRASENAYLQGIEDLKKFESEATGILKELEVSRKTQQNAVEKRIESSIARRFLGEARTRQWRELSKTVASTRKDQSRKIISMVQVEGVTKEIEIDLPDGALKDLKRFRSIKMQLGDEPLHAYSYPDNYEKIQKIYVDFEGLEPDRSAILNNVFTLCEQATTSTSTNYIFEEVLNPEGVKDAERTDYDLLPNRDLFIKFEKNQVIIQRIYTVRLYTPEHPQGGYIVESRTTRIPLSELKTVSVTGDNFKNYTDVSIFSRILPTLDMARDYQQTLSEAASKQLGMTPKEQGERKEQKGEEERKGGSGVERQEREEKGGG